MPRATGLYEVENGVDHQSPWSRWPAGGGWFGQHRSENLPLGIGDIGVEIGVLHRFDSRCRGDLATSCEVASQGKNADLLGFFSKFYASRSGSIRHLSFQTGSNGP